MMTTAHAESEHEILLPDEAWLDALEQDIFAQDDPTQDDISFFALLSVTGDNDNNRQLNASLRTLFAEYYSLEAELGQRSIRSSDADYTIKSYWLGFGSAGAYGFNWHLSTRSWGKSQTIETSDEAFELSYRTLDLWFISLLLEQGNVVLFLDPVFSDRRASLSSDRNGWGINIAHDMDTGAWWLSYLQRDYERDLPALDNRLTLQLIVQNIALNQAYSLSSNEYAIGYQWFLNRADLSIELSRITSVVDKADSDFLTLSYRYYVNSSINLQSSLQSSLDEDLYGLTLGLGMLW